MGSCIQPTTAHLPRRLAGLAAAVTGLAARSTGAAETPHDPAPIRAEPRTPPVHSSYQTWLAFTAAGTVRDPVHVFLDLAGGFADDMHPAAFVARPGVGVRLPHGFSAFVGYTYIAFWDAHHARGEEHEAFQQVGYQAPFTAVGLSGRIRTEQRFRAGSDVGLRLRALAQLDVPFWPRSPLHGVVSNELFFGLNHPGPWQPNVLDQDLFYVGLGWEPDPHFRADAGYQAAIVPRREETSLVHCLSISTSATW